jgi:hypothetical protein
MPVLSRDQASTQEASMNRELDKAEIHLTCQGCFQDWAFTEAEIIELKALYAEGQEGEAEIHACPKCLSTEEIVGHA